MKRALMLFATLVLAGGCSTGQVPSALRSPALDRGDAEQVALHADDVRREALTAADAAGLTALFRGRALQMLQAQVLAMRQRGLRSEERDYIRTLVFLDARAHEIVLEVEAQHRLVTPDQTDPVWTATVRQSWSHLDYAGGTWWVDDRADLTPDRWRPVPTSA